MIQLTFHSAAQEDVELASRYWAMNAAGKFENEIADLLTRNHIASKALLEKRVRSLADAYDTNQVCLQCGGYEKIRRRSDAQRAAAPMHRPCLACMNRMKVKRSKTASKGMLEQRPVSIRYDDLGDDTVMLLLALEASSGSPGLQIPCAVDDYRKLAPGPASYFFNKLRQANAIVESSQTKGAFLLAPDIHLGAGTNAVNHLRGRELNDSCALYRLWLDLATVDCMAYFRHRCRVHKFTLAETTEFEVRRILSNWLQRLSVKHVWFITYCVLKDMSPESGLRLRAAHIPELLYKRLEDTADDQGVGRMWNRSVGPQGGGTLWRLFAQRYDIDEGTPGSEASLRLAGQLPLVDDGEPDCK